MQSVLSISYDNNHYTMRTLNVNINILESIDTIIINILIEKDNVDIYLDFSKAFNMVSHYCLQGKMKTLVVNIIRCFWLIKLWK